MENMWAYSIPHTHHTHNRDHISHCIVTILFRYGELVASSQHISKTNMLHELARLCGMRLEGRSNQLFASIHMWIVCNVRYISFIQFIVVYYSPKLTSAVRIFVNHAKLYLLWNLNIQAISLNGDCCSQIVMHILVSLTILACPFLFTYTSSIQISLEE